MANKKINYTKLRKAAGFSKSDVARKLGVHINTYSLWERGLGGPSEENLKKLKKLFKIEG